MNIILQIAGIQGLEWIILLVFIILILFGARKIPELARSIGKATGEFTRGRKEIEREIKTISEEVEDIGKTVRTEIEDIEKTVRTEIEDIKRVARELGIKTEGKKENEIRKEIIDKLETKDEKQVEKNSNKDDR